MEHTPGLDSSPPSSDTVEVEGGAGALRPGAKLGPLVPNPGLFSRTTADSLDVVVRAGEDAVPVVDDDGA
jgi:hypothetical protein